ncbi:chaperonin 10-like protein [Calycina marina]|uniref:Chaperonin 10-like protein n=1 Tax=Calycina marina TaxID=1763456 RepID=A0A9P7ZAD2_9HELO|nr:chaperonin 10-like protein [Calycina marina]
MSNQGIIAIEGTKATIQDIPIPKLRNDYVLIKVKAVALNPTDWKHIAFGLAPPGAKVGCDYAGVVEEIGSAVTKPFKKGDRIAGFAHGGNAVYHEDGSFSNYITAKGDIQTTIPDNLSFEEASTIGVSFLTVGQALYQSLEMPLPGKGKFDGTLLIYGGSTASGAIGIQFAKLSGAKVVVTASPKNFDYVKSLGADAAFDYNSPTCSEDIKAWSNGSITHAFDCISEGSSTDITVAAMSTSSPGIYTNLLSVKGENIPKNIANKSTLAYTAIGEAFTWPMMDFPAQPENLEFGKMFMEITRQALADGSVKVHKPSVNKYGEGLEGVMKGMQAMKEGKVSGEKLVFVL